MRLHPEPVETHLLKFINRLATPYTEMPWKEKMMRNKLKRKVLGMMLLTNLFGAAVFADEQANEKLLVQDNSAFAIDLYQQLGINDGNLFFSPYSISTALAMAYACARGYTLIALVTI